MNESAISRPTNPLLTRVYGKTGIAVSAVGFGGMRFKTLEDPDACVALVLRAYEGGVTYFDTAPGYCQGQSEVFFGRAFQQMRRTRHKRPFTVSTKSAKREPDALRADLEQSLKNMGLDAVDIFHVWCVTSWEDYQARHAKGIFRMCEQLRAEGLIRHIAMSTHMPGEDIARALRDYPLDGVLLGYSAMNFPYRDAGVQAASELGCAVVVMNPLGGGMIPQHPERFACLRTGPSETVAQGALRFLLADPRITVALVGMGEPRDVDEALAAASREAVLPPGQIERIRAQLNERFDQLCTGCRYCEPCPQGVPIAKLMDVYNHAELNAGQVRAAIGRLQGHWGIALDDPCLEACVQCGRCEALCTQKLPIEDRLRAVARWAEEAAADPARQP